MRNFVIGDLQGCLDPLRSLLDQVNFDPAGDKLYGVGDLVNRGPRSLETLRFCKELGPAFDTVLGNHDLHLLALVRGERASNHKDTLEGILSAPDRGELLDWLQARPLLLRVGRDTLVHAGIPPQWSVDEAEVRAREVEQVLRSEVASTIFFRGMYGNTPVVWRDDLEGVERLRCITNYFTRMRYCDSEGNLDLTNKQAPPEGPAGFMPWFDVPLRKAADDRILFGHWASLRGITHNDHAVALDTGCVWGGQMTMICLENGRLYHQNCQ